MKSFICFIIGFLFFNYAFGEDAKKKIEDEVIEKIRVFIDLDFKSIPKDDPRRKNRGRYFFVRELNDCVELSDKKSRYGYKTVPGKYRRFEIINEINTVGTLVRTIVISPEQEVFWITINDSLMELFTRPENSLAAGGDEVTHLFLCDLEHIIERLKNSEQVEYLHNYKNKPRELEDFKKKVTYTGVSLFLWNDDD